MQRTKGETEIALERRLKEHGRKRSTIKLYCMWYYRYMLYLREKHKRWMDPRTIGEREFEEWLSHLANDLHVSPKTQNQAFSAICYLYRHVLKRPLENVSALRAKGETNERTILDQPEVEALLGVLTGVEKLVAMMMYGCGVRIGECGLLRMKDFDFGRRQITVWHAKGGKSRRIQFPKALDPLLERQIESVKVLWRYDVADGLNGISLPHAYGRKRPSAHLDFAWYYLLAADDYSKCPDTGILYRHSRDMQHIGKGITAGFHSLGIPKKFSPHVLRHTYATHLLELGTPVHYVQQLLGHASLETTMIYLHACKDRATESMSPVDFLDGLATSSQATGQLAHLLANPQLVPQIRGEKPKLRIYAG